MSGECEVDHYLVAMIDGESVGFALAQKTTSLHLDKIWHGKTADYPTFIDALQFYLKEHGLQPRQYECAVAVAGVPRGDVISLANCRWYVSIRGLSAFLRSEPIVLNDFAATAWSLTALDRSKLLPVGSQPPRPIQPGATFQVVGTGCGLGVATLHITRRGEVVVIESEGGHSSFAPQNELEEEILPHLRRQFGHVSYERIVSEPGLENVYRALAARAGKSGPAPTAAAIKVAARQRTDPLAVDTIKIFANALGSFIGTTTMTLGAWDGVFLTGEMLQEMLPALNAIDFRARMTAKGRLSKLLAEVPVAMVNYSETRLLGAAAALASRQASEPARAAAA
jgi:glucokinase